MPINTKVDVDVKSIDADELFKSKVNKLMVLSGARLNEIMTEESRTRADGLGGRDGAVDTGTLSNSIVVLEQGWDRVVVGTRVGYARTLAEGRPDPGASLEAITRWRKRKKIPRRSKQVWNKITTEGPIANPFHERTVDRFTPESVSYTHLTLPTILLV